MDKIRYGKGAVIIETGGEEVTIPVRMKCSRCGEMVPTGSIDLTRPGLSRWRLGCSDGVHRIDKRK